MAYLIVFLAVALAGIGVLWLNQLRTRAQLRKVDFYSNLEKISTGPAAEVPPELRRTHSARAYSRRLKPLDPARRDAARRRMQARRKLHGS